MGTLFRFWSYRRFVFGEKVVPDPVSTGLPAEAPEQASTTAPQSAPPTAPRTVPRM
jgi:hypothetical protein